MNEWQPIETAPKDGKKILAYVDGENWTGCTILKYHIPSKEWSCSEDDERGFYESSILGWMPLPEPPLRKHHCHIDPCHLGTCVCTRGIDGKLYIETYHTYDDAGRKSSFECNFCPMCGEKA